MTAVLSFLDFFPAVVQRTAVSTAATMAARTSMETLSCALEALPQLLPLLDYQDHAIADSACLALNRITTAAAGCAPAVLSPDAALRSGPAHVHLRCVGRKQSHYARSKSRLW